MQQGAQSRRKEITDDNRAADVKRKRDARRDPEYREAEDAGTAERFPGATVWLAGGQPIRRRLCGV